MRRRTYLRLAGASAVTAAAGRAQAAEDGYGEGGFGEGGFGGSSDSDDGGDGGDDGDDGDDGTDELSDPVIEALVLDDTSGPNPHVDLEAVWEVTHPDDALETVRLVVRNDDERVIDGTTVDVDGGSASGTDLFRIKHGAGETYAVTLRAIDQMENTASTTASIATSR